MLCKMLQCLACETLPQHNNTRIMASYTSVFQMCANAEDKKVQTIYIYYYIIIYIYIVCISTVYFAIARNVFFSQVNVIHIWFVALWPQSYLSHHKPVVLYMSLLHHWIATFFPCGLMYISGAKKQRWDTSPQKVIIKVFGLFYFSMQMTFRLLPYEPVRCDILLLFFCTCMTCWDRYW